MVRPLNDSPYLFGLHDPGGERLMAEKGAPGWIVFTEELGSDPGNQSGRDYSRWAKQGFGIIARLNHGYEPNGTIPPLTRYADFARRCANFVRRSQGCHIWVIGNEPNHPVERPGVSMDHNEQPPRIRVQGEVILPVNYANCYRQCRTAIRALEGHQSDQVIVAAIAPWNAQTTYPENPSGDWVKYLADVLKILGAAHCDGVALHTYTHGPDPRLITADTRMSPPFYQRQFNFRTYQDFMHVIPRRMRSLPVYLTEVDQNDPWTDQNSGWIQQAYDDINQWNQQAANQKIRAVVLYRWPKKLDKWGIEGKHALIEDFKQAVSRAYTWEGCPPVETYLARFVSHTTPAVMVAGQATEVTLAVENTGTATWPADGQGRVLLGHFWMDGRGQLVKTNGAGERTKLPKNIAPGGQVHLRSWVTPPTTPGTYTLQWDMLEENLEWYAEHSSPPLALKVVVEAAQAADPASIKFSETGFTAGGAFAAFYKKYGVGITGFPISAEYVNPQTGLKTQEWQRLFLEQQAPGTIRLQAIGQELKDLRKKAATLQQQLDGLLAQVDGTQGLEISDITSELPRDAAGFLKRPPEAIKYIVINHTGAQPEVDAAAVAEAHRARWPGIVGQYFVTGTGKIQQTNPLDQVVAKDQSWIYNGINIYLAGTFNSTVPGRSVMEALARLVAWLLEKCHLDLSAVRGTSEFIVTNSPGDQWLEGQRWKDQLLRSVREIQQSGGMDASGVVPRLLTQVRELEAEIAAAKAEIARLAKERSELQGKIAGLERAQADLKAQAATLVRDQETAKQKLDAVTADRDDKAKQIETLTAAAGKLEGQVQSLNAEKAVLVQQANAMNQEKAALTRTISELEARIRALQTGGAPSGAGTVPAPAMVDVADALPKHPTQRYEQRALSKITHIAIHHSAGPANATAQGIANYHIGKGWPGIGYHFYVDPEGTIYQTNRLETVSYHASNSNAYSVGICLAGTFHDVVPVARQIEQTGHLVAWLMQKLNVKIEQVVGHRELPGASTECPGNSWLGGAQWKQTLVARIQTVLAGHPGQANRAISHYVLFWQHGDQWASEDWVSATSYIARFRPTVGFSPDDARAAEYVTIVGGSAGVSAETEQVLASAGCKVERIAGADTGDTKRILDEMAQRGQRFRTLNGRG